MNPLVLIRFQDEFLAVVEAMAKKTNATQEIVNLFNEISSGAKKLVPETIYVRFVMGGSNLVEFFDPTLGNNRTIGQHKLENGKLPNGMFFVPFSMQLLAAVTANDPTDADLRTAKYGPIASLPTGTVRNAEIDLTMDGFPILKDFAAMNFDTVSNANLRAGEFLLPTRRLLEPQREIRGSIKAPAGQTFPAKTIGEVALHGLATSVVKAN